MNKHRKTEASQHYGITLPAMRKLIGRLFNRSITTKVELDRNGFKIEVCCKESEEGLYKQIGESLTSTQESPFIAVDVHSYIPKP